MRTLGLDHTYGYCPISSNHSKQPITETIIHKPHPRAMAQRLKVDSEHAAYGLECDVAYVPAPAPIASRHGGVRVSQY